MSFDPYEFDRDYGRSSQALTEGQYTVQTFQWMVLGLLVTFGVAVFGWMTNLTLYLLMYVPIAPIVLLIVMLVMVFTLAGRIERMSVGTAKSLFFGYSTLMGLTFSLYLYLYDLGSILIVFLATAVYFGALAAYGYFTRRDLSGAGPILFSGLIFLIVFELLMLFILPLTMFENLVCLIGVAVFLGYTAYDTQKIRSYYYHYVGFPDMLEKASIFSALQLYLDFLNLFLYLLRFMGRSRD